MTHHPPGPKPHSEPGAEALGDLFRQLERAFREVFAADSAEPDTECSVFQEALLAVTARRREIEKPGEGPPGMDRLRRMKYWHERQQGVCEAVDQVLIQHFGDRRSSPIPDDLQSLLGQMIDQLPPRCRGLLRLRYGLDVATGPIAVKLSDRKAGIRKTTGRCLTAISRLLIERGLVENG